MREDTSDNADAFTAAELAVSVGGGGSIVAELPPSTVAAVTIE